MKPEQIAGAGEGRVVVLTDTGELWMYNARLSEHLDKRRQWSRIKGAPWEREEVGEDEARVFFT